MWKFCNFWSVLSSVSARRKDAQERSAFCLWLNTSPIIRYSSIRSSGPGSSRKNVLNSSKFSASSRFHFHSILLEKEMDNELTIYLFIRSCSTFSLESTPKVAEKECKLKLIKVYNKIDAKLTRTRISKHRSFCSATLYGSCSKVFGRQSHVWWWKTLRWRAHHSHLPISRPTPSSVDLGRQKTSNYILNLNFHWSHLNRFVFISFLFWKDPTRMEWDR